MLSSYKLIWMLLLPVISGSVAAQEEGILPGTCGQIDSTFRFSRPPGSPKVFGERFQVPRFELAFIDKDEKRLGNHKVILWYTWRWFEYPYPEHRNGVWSTAYDLISCQTDDNGRVIIPSHAVLPSGWYDGRRLKRQLPEFQDIQVGIFAESGNYTFYVTPRELKELSGDGSFKRTFKAERK